MIYEYIFDDGIKYPITVVYCNLDDKWINTMYINTVNRDNCLLSKLTLSKTINCNTIKHMYTLNRFTNKTTIFGIL